MEIKGELQKKIREALEGAFSVEEFTMFLEEDLSISSDEIPQGGSNINFFFESIKYLNRQGQIKDLLNQCCQVRPDKSQIQEIKKIYDLCCIICSDNGISFEQLKHCYGQVLANTIADSPDKADVKNINEIINNLLDHKDYFNNINIFVDQLQKLQKQNTKIGNNLESYLLISVKPRSTNKNNNDFFIQAELITDYCNCPDKIEYIIDTIIEKNEENNINENEDRGILSSSEELNKKLSELITEAEKYLKNECSCKGTSYTLTIELFLPWNYLGEDFDIRITYKDEYGEIRPIGERYRLIIRCLDYYQPYNFNNLVKRWERKKCLCSEDHSNYLVELDRLDELRRWRTLANEWHKNEKIGVKLLCCLPIKDSDLKESFFKTILRGGVVFALWSRQDNLSEGNLSDLINSIVSWECVQNLNLLCQNVLEKRGDAHQEENAHQYLGYHLGILCENPERIPSYWKTEPLKMVNS